MYRTMFFVRIIYIYTQSSLEEVKSCLRATIRSSRCKDCSFPSHKEIFFKKLVERFEERGVMKKLESLPTLSHSDSISSSGLDKSARCCSNFLDSEDLGSLTYLGQLGRMAQGSLEKDIRMIF